MWEERGKKILVENGDPVNTTHGVVNDITAALLRECDSISSDMCASPVICEIALQVSDVAYISGWLTHKRRLKNFLVQEF